MTTGLSGGSLRLAGPGRPDPTFTRNPRRRGGSELEARHNLHLARMEAVCQAADLTEVAAAPPESCPVEAGAIECVESLHPDLESHMLPNAELLSQSQIDVLDPLRIQILKVPGSATGLLVARVLKAR